MSDVWACDVRISQPESNKNDLPPLVDLGGFTFTAGGISHDVPEADAQELFSPYFSPSGNLQ